MNWTPPWATFTRGPVEGWLPQRYLRPLSECPVFILKSKAQALLFLEIYGNAYSTQLLIME